MHYYPLLLCSFSTSKYEYEGRPTPPPPFFLPPNLQCNGRYMSKMDGCQGRVTLAKDDESFKKWGIEIVVRFRSENDGGKEAVLNKYVHSGGERSVSTILFLMALQAC